MILYAEFYLPICSPGFSPFHGFRWAEFKVHRDTVDAATKIAVGIRRIQAGRFKDCLNIYLVFGAWNFGALSGVADLTTVFRPVK